MSPMAVIGEACTLVRHLRLAVDEVVHHHDVMLSVVVHPGSHVTRCDPYFRDARIGENHAEERLARVAGRGRYVTTKDQSAVFTKDVELRGRTTPASVWLINVGEDGAKCVDHSRCTTIGAGHEEQRIRHVAAHRAEQSQRTERTEDRRVRRIIEQRRQAAVGSTRRGRLREPRSGRCELGTSGVENTSKGVTGADVVAFAPPPSQLISR